MTEQIRIFYATLGNHPDLSMIELTSILDVKDGVRMGNILQFSLPSPLADNFITTIGGSDRILEHMAEFDHFPTPDEIVQCLSPLPQKIKIGLSIYGGRPELRLEKLGIDLKKAARAAGVKLSFIVPSGRAQALNTAQVLFNRLHRSPNSELVFLEHEGHWILARTIQIQDIQQYELRDTSRPARDARSGMLPPKLAQIMLNIAVGHLPHEQSQGISGEIALLDPFCGSGTLLQEGWLMGYQMVGSDKLKKTIEDAAENMRHLAAQFDVDGTIQPELLTHDATHVFPEGWDNSFSGIVTEPYLGKPLHRPLSPTEAQTSAKKLHKLYRSFFQYAYSVLQPEGIILFLFPVLSTTDAAPRRVLVDIIDEIEAFGYHQIHLLPGEMPVLYGRPDALVKREVTLWQKAS